VLATISHINNSRNFVDADIDVPAGDRPALLTFSRPYFRGYKARIGDQELAITSYRGLFPILEIPAGTQGRLTVAYRPAWLLWGGSMAAVCGLIILLGMVAGWRYSSSGGTESCP
jgi:arabinofuranan 3-O-arabinosyltransferase